MSFLAIISLALTAALSFLGGKFFFSKAKIIPKTQIIQEEKPLTPRCRLQSPEYDKYLVNRYAGYRLRRDITASDETNTYR